MKNFKFSLESVLKWKRSQEEKALELMGLAMRRRQEIFETLQASRRRLGALLMAVRQARAGTIDGWTQVAYTREMGRLEGFCKHHEEMLARAKTEEEIARQTYLQRRCEAEALEKLKEKRSLLCQKENDRLMERELEEIMLSREGNLLCG